MENKEKNFVSAVIYLYNDEKHIVDFIKGLDETLQSNFLKYEIIIVNDNSTDKSIEVVKQYAKNHEASAIQILNMSYHQGVEVCMNAGLDLAIGDFVFQFEYVKNDWAWVLIMDAYRQSLKGYDIVCTVNKSRPKYQPLFYYLFNKYANVQNEIHANSFCLITRRGINRVQSLTMQVPFRQALYANCGLGMFNLTYKYPSDGINARQSRHHYSSLILFTDLGYKITRNMALMMIAIILLVIAYAIAIFFMGHPVEGGPRLCSF